MDEVLGEVLDLLPLLRAAGREAEATSLLRSLTDGCNAREILMSLQAALGDLPEDLGPELDARVSRMLGDLSDLLQAF